MKHLTSICVGMLAVLTPVCSFGTTLTFNEFGTDAPISANSLEVAGVTFGFAPDGAVYDGMIGTDGNTVFAVDPVLTGPTSGILTLTFALPTTEFGFDLALQSIMPIGDSILSMDGGPAYTVTLSNGMVFQENTTPQPGGFYSEGQFLYQGLAIYSASVAFYQGQDDSGMTVESFGLDNLTYDAGAAPEPGTMCLIGFGFVALAFAIRRTGGEIKRGNKVGI